MSRSIAATRVHTPLNDVGRVDISDAFPLFRESSGTVQNSLGGSRQWVLVDVEPQVLAWKVHFVMGAGVYYGVNGPSYAVDVLFTGAQDGNALTLTGSQARAIAGMELGFGARFFMTMDIQQWSVETHWVSDGWSSHLAFDTSWNDAGRLNVDVTIDLISALLGHIPSTQFGSRKNRFPSGSGLDAVESTSTNSLATTGQTMLSPTFTAIWDLTASVAKIKEAKDTILKRYHAVLSVGPTINLSLPTTIKIVKAATGGSLYDLQAQDGVLSGIRSGPSAVGDGELEVTFRHTTSVAIGFGLAGSLTWLKVLSIGFNSGPLIDLMSIFGFPRTAGPYEHRLRSTVGGTSVATVAALEPNASCEVVFEEPEHALA